MLEGLKLAPFGTHALFRFILNFAVRDGNAWSVCRFASLALVAGFSFGIVSFPVVTEPFGCALEAIDIAI